MSLIGGKIILGIIVKNLLCQTEIIAFPLGVNLPSGEFSGSTLLGGSSGTPLLGSSEAVKSSSTISSLDGSPDLPLGKSPEANSTELQTSTSFLQGKGTPITLLGAAGDRINDPGVDTSSLVNLAKLSEQMSQIIGSLTSGASAVINASSSLTNTMSAITSGATQITIQIQNLSKISEELGTKMTMKPLEIVQPVIDSQIQMAKAITTSMTDLVKNVDMLRKSIFSIMTLAPIAFGALVLCVLLLIIIIVLVLLTWKKIRVAGNKTKKNMPLKT